MMRNIRFVILSFIIIIAFPLVISAIGIDVPATDPVYDFLKRLETRGVIKGFNDLTLPLTRDEIVNFLQIASQKADELSAIEKKILHEFLADYRYETERQLTEPDSISAPFYQKNYFRQATANLFSRQDAVEENHLLMYETAGRLFVGALPGGKNPLDGAIDDLRIYKRALSAAEVSQLYNQR